MALDTEKIIADLKEASILELNDLVEGNILFHGDEHPYPGGARRYGDGDRYRSDH